MERPLDFSEGSGSLSEEECYTDREALYVDDGRSGMETTFNANEGDKGILMSDGERRPWSYLYEQNEGYYCDDRAERTRQVNTRRDAATFCNHVDCTPHQQRRVLFHVDDLDLNSFGATSSEVIILSLITFVCNQDGRWVQRESAYSDLLDALDVDSKKVKRTQRSIKEKLAE